MDQQEESPYEAAVRRLKEAGGHYATYVDRVAESAGEVPQTAPVDANLVPAGIGAAAGIPQAVFRTLRGASVPTSTVADIARTVATEGAPAAGMPAAPAKATGRGAAVINYANQVTPELTNLEALRAGDYKQANVQNRIAQSMADQTRGFRPGENLMLPREVIEEQAARQSLADKKAARPSISKAAAAGLRGAGDILGNVAYKGLPIVGGGLSAYEIAEAIDEYNRGEPLNAAVSGLGGLGGLMMMSRNPVRIGAGALMTVPSLIRSGYRALNKPE
jgi:hypothetical protein